MTVESRLGTERFPCSPPMAASLALRNHAVLESTLWPPDSHGGDCYIYAGHGIRSVEADSTHIGHNQPRETNDVEERRTGGVARPAVLPATVREPNMDSYRVDDRWNCKLELSTA
jgi:hypothetical protein